MAVALDEEEEDEMSIESRSIGTVGEAPSYAFNVRIKVRYCCAIMPFSAMPCSAM